MDEFASLANFRASEDYRIDSLHCKLYESAKLHGVSGHIELDLSDDFYFVNSGKRYAFTINQPEQENLIKEFFSRNFLNIAENTIMQENAEDELHLKVVFFSQARQLGNMKIIFTDHVIRQMQKNKMIGNQEKISDVMLEPLGSKFLLRNGNDTTAYHLVAFVESSQKLKEIAKEERASLAHIKALNEEPESVIELFGVNLVLTIGIYDDTEGDGTLAVAHRITSSRRNLPCMQLGQGNLSFTTMKAYSSESVRKVIKENGDYIKIWNMYSNKEGEFLLKRNRAIGLIGYENNISVVGSEGITELAITIKPESEHVLELLKKGDTLRSDKDMPSYIMDADMNWNRYVESINAGKMKYKTNNNVVDDDNGHSDDSEDIYSDDNIDNGEAVQKENDYDEQMNYGRYEITRIDKKTNVIYVKPISEKHTNNISGHLFYDDIGDLLQIFRRQDARERIENGTSANPYLGLLIAGADDVGDVLRKTSVRSKKHIEAMTDNVYKKLFFKKVGNEIKEYPPTETQKRAIEIALNTPDIAIIQGPPGTGKTTVITAILERLNEMADKNQLERGQVLITSLQHDAVKNVINRISINSLPTVKFGSRRGEEMNMDETIEKWCNDLAENIRKKNPSLQESKVEHDLADAFSLYNINPSEENARSFLKMAMKVVADKEILDEISRLYEEYINGTKNNDSGNDSLMQSIRRLPTKKKSFLDGGADLADAILARLEDKLSTENEENKTILTTLGEAADCFEQEPSQDLLKRLSKCKKILLRRGIPRPNYEHLTVSQDFVELYEKIQTTFSRKLRKEDNILYEFLKELENNPDNIKDAVKGYSFAFAATAQQSLHKEITSVKGKIPEYDTVIVDEAARVNPGDLMIPLSQAKRRIIMVGDHRQLPHMYDEEIFESLTNDGADFDTADIKESMFEYLLRKAKELTARDRIQRFITLDAQYRMHPDLGNFVSNNFYKQYGESFGSPLSPEHFVQRFTREPMLWINVPHSRGDVKRYNGSPRRDCEIECIIKKIQLFYNQMGEQAENSKKKISIGIISFYRAQVDHIKVRLRKVGLDKKVDVGTVDAFQGMEYDIIFLSVVRTGIDLRGKSLDYLEKNEEDFSNSREKREFLHIKDKIGRTNYGFLTSENRLCVALSRQKKLLIVVGDAELFHGKQGGRLAQIFVPALKNFYELCLNKGVVENA